MSKNKEEWFVVEHANPKKAECTKIFSVSKKIPDKIAEKMNDEDNESTFYHESFKSKDDAIKYIDSELLGFSSYNVDKNDKKNTKIWSDMKFYKDDEDVKFYGYEKYVNIEDSKLDYKDAEDLGLKLGMDNDDYDTLAEKLYNEQLDNNICIMNDISKYLKERVDNLHSSYICRGCDLKLYAEDVTNKIHDYNDIDRYIEDNEIIEGTFLCLDCEEEIEREGINIEPGYRFLSDEYCIDCKSRFCSNPDHHHETVSWNSKTKKYEL